MSRGVYERKFPIWNKGLTKETDIRVKKYSDSRKGQKRPTVLGNKNASKRIDVRKKISDKAKNKKFSLEHIKNIGISSRRKYPKNKYPNHGLRKLWKSSNFVDKMKKVRSNLVIPYRDTTIEIKIQNYLKLLHIEFITHFYVSEITHAYQCDIFIPANKIIIECDGCYWHGCKICNKNFNQLQLEQIEEDKFRTKELVNKGYVIYRLWEHDIRKMQLNEFKEIVKC